MRSAVTDIHLVGSSPQDQTVPSSMHDFNFEGMGVHIYSWGIVSGETRSPVRVKHLARTTSGRTRVAHCFGLLSSNCGKKFQCHHKDLTNQELQIHASLEDWGEGHYKKTEFNADLYEDVYRG